MAPEVLSKYTGTYEIGTGTPAVMTLEGDLLFLQIGANPLKLPVAPDSEKVFVERTNGDLIDFTMDSQGVVTGFTFHQRGKDLKAVRKGSAPK